MRFIFLNQIYVCNTSYNSCSRGWLVEAQDSHSCGLQFAYDNLTKIVSTQLI